MMMYNWFESGFLHLENYLYAGGFVMLPLLLLCMVLWCLIANRLFFFRRMYQKNMPPRIALAHILDERMPDPAQYGDATSMLVAEYLCHNSRDAEVNGFILEETVHRINRRITAYLAVIGALAAIAPLLGLLGTVTGMMNTFDVMAVFGTGNAKAMANGISEALITTQTGLLIAIPGLYMKGFLDRRSRNLQQYLETVGYYLKRHFGNLNNERRDD